jgi:hypothetical protein
LKLSIWWSLAVALAGSVPVPAVALAVIELRQVSQFQARRRSLLVVAAQALQLRPQQAPMGTRPPFQQSIQAAVVAAVVVITPQMVAQVVPVAAERLVVDQQAAVTLVHTHLQKATTAARRPVLLVVVVVALVVSVLAVQPHHPTLVEADRAQHQALPGHR